MRIFKKVLIGFLLLNMFVLNTSYAQTGGIKIQMISTGELNGTILESNELVVVNETGELRLGNGNNAGGTAISQDRIYTSPSELSYTSDGTNITITGYTGTSPNLFIPPMIIGLPVKYIGTYAMRSNSVIKSLRIPKFVETSESSFSYCQSLQSIYLDEQATIGTNAFRNCTNLTSVTLGEGMTNIGRFAFQSCSNLATVTIPQSVVALYAFAFAYCPKLSAVYFKGNAPTVISSSFSGNTNIVYYPSGATGYNATLASRTTAVWTNVPIPAAGIIQSGVTSTPSVVNGLISLPPPIAISTNAESSYATNAGYATNSGYATNWAQSDSKQDLIYSLASDITYTTNAGAITNENYIGSSLTVNIPPVINGMPVTTIGNSAFSWDTYPSMTHITNVVFPSSINNMSASMFFENKSIVSVTFEGDIFTIPDITFYDCTSLSEVIFRGYATGDENSGDIFTGCTNNIFLRAGATISYYSNIGVLSIFYGRPIILYGPVTVSGIISGTDTNLPNTTNGFVSLPAPAFATNSTYSSYSTNSGESGYVTNAPKTNVVVALNLTNTLSYANGNLQCFVPTNNCVIALPAVSGAATNLIHSIRLDLVATNWIIGFDTNNLLGSDALTIYTNRTTKLLFDCGYRETNWWVNQL